MLSFCNPDDQQLSNSIAHTDPNQRSLTGVGGLQTPQKGKNYGQGT